MELDDDLSRILRAAQEGHATAAIGRYIDGFYNPIHRHPALDFASPAQFEKLAVA
jgi:transposase InsO family protein